MVCADYGFLHVWPWRTGGALGHPTSRMAPLEATPHVSRNRREDGFHGSTCLAWRSAMGATSQIYRDSNHGKTRKSDMLGTLKPSVLVWRNHGGFEALSRGF